MLLRELCPQFAQHPLHNRCVLAAHAQQQLLSARQGLELRVGKLVQHVRSHQLDRFFNVRRGQQVIDHLDDTVVEVSVRIPEALIGLLQQRIEAAVSIDDIVNVGRRDATYQAIVALIIFRAQVDGSILAIDISSERVA